jgi:DNA-directed RNA polymerase omega subunit
MMIEPPIDELEKKSKNNKYILSVVAAKRAKEIETTRRAELATADKKAISIALDEIYNGQVVGSDINE